MSAKASCFTCENKDISGVFKCEGCSQAFCLKHTTEHREYLNDQLNDIICEHRSFTNTLNENRYQTSVLFDQINQWEKDSINKIQQTAQNIRLEIQHLDESQKKQTKDQYNQMRSELEHACEYHEFLEKDLSRWKILLEQFKYDLTRLSPSINLYQDSKQALVHQLFISKLDQQSMLNEKLMSYSDQIQFNDEHHMAMHCGPERAPAYVIGTQEYATGQYHIRLFLSKKTNEFVLSFNIMSKLMDISSNSTKSEFFTYGWQSNDCLNPSQYSPSNEKNFQDLRGNTKFHINLIIDCDRQKISYYNEKSKRTRVINVDVNKCPLPWKLYFYLYDVGDVVRLLSSTKIV